MGQCADASRRKLQRPSAGRNVCSTSKGFQASRGREGGFAPFFPPSSASAKSWCEASSTNSRKISIRKCGVLKNLPRLAPTGRVRARVACISLGVFYHQSRSSCTTVLLQARRQWRKIVFFLVQAHRCRISPLVGGHQGIFHSRV